MLYLVFHEHGRVLEVHLFLTSYFMNLVESSRSISSFFIGLSMVASARQRSVSRPDYTSIQRITSPHTTIISACRGVQQVNGKYTNVFLRDLFLFLWNPMIQLQNGLWQSHSVWCGAAYKCFNHVNIRSRTRVFDECMH